MGKKFAALEPDHTRLIAEQHLFFVASAAPTGRVNLSPKGMDSLRVLGPNRLLWLNWTGSGNETAGHLRLDPRMTVMWCSFGKRPVILRVYGTARAVHRHDAAWDGLYAHFDPTPSARQVFDLNIDLVQTSCGFAVPFMDFACERDTLRQWADQRGDEDIRRYWDDRNRRTIDGLPTGVLGDE